MKALLKIFGLIIVSIAFFSGSVRGNGNCINTVSGDSTMSLKQNNFITFNPLQLAYGEFIVGIEKPKSNDVFNIYRLGLIYSFGDFYGLHFECGRKVKIGQNFYRSIILLAKYEYKNYEWELDDWNIYANNSLILKDNKYVLGVKVLYSIPTSYEHKIISDFYFGFGLRLHYYQRDLNFEIPNPSNTIIVPSIHLGITLMYNLNER